MVRRLRLSWVWLGAVASAPFLFGADGGCSGAPFQGGSDAGTTSDDAAIVRDSAVADTDSCPGITPCPSAERFDIGACRCVPIDAGPLTADASIDATSHDASSTHEASAADDAAPDRDASKPDDDASLPNEDASMPDDAATGTCTTAADCHGALPALCKVCLGSPTTGDGCAHFSCVNGTCEIVYCD
jgi:hypothetical protein